MPEIGLIVENTSALSIFSNQLYQRTLYSDVIIDVQGKRVHSHTFILLAYLKNYRLQLSNLKYNEFQLPEVKIDAPLEAFKILLKFMYTGTVNLREYEVPDVVEFLKLVQAHDIHEVTQKVVDYLCVAVDVESAAKTLEIAKNSEYEDLEELCWNLVEMIIEGIYEIADFQLNYQLLADLIMQRERRITEINIFEFLVKMTQNENFCSKDQKKELFRKIQYERIGPEDLKLKVKPLKCLSDSTYRTIMVKYAEDCAEKVYAGFRFNVRISAEENDQELLSFTDQYASFSIREGSHILVDFEKILIFNFLKFNLINEECEAYSYLIEVSKDNKKWVKLVDYSHIWCHSTQTLYFPQTRARFIRIIGKRALKAEEFSCNSFLICFEDQPLKSFDGFVVPTENMAIPSLASVNASNSSRHMNFHQNQLLNGQFNDLVAPIPGYLNIVFNQPYILDSCRFRLWDYNGRKSSFKVEVSPDMDVFEVVSDKSDEKVDGWQVMKFAPRPVVTFRITGVAASEGNELRLVHFEAPSQF